MNQIERLVNVGFKRSNAEDICMWYMALDDKDGLEKFVRLQEESVKKGGKEE